MTNIKAAIIFAALAAIVNGQRFPIISFISPERVIDIGGAIELECSVQYAFNYPVLWIRVDSKDPARSIPISTGSNLIIKDGRFSLRYDQASSTYTLQIKDIQESDSGKYQCQVLLTLTEKTTADVSLSVRIPPIIYDNSTRSVVVSEGQPVKLECYAGGFPLPKISWRRENNAVLPTGGSLYRGNILTIPSVRKEDRGTYYCVAENGVGKKSTRRNIAVEVEFAPVITLPRPRVEQAVGYDAILECQVIAFPPPSVVWYRNDIEISENQHFSISNFNTVDEFTDSVLRILTVEPQQFGEYYCKADNKLGVAQAKVDVAESYYPVCPPACGKYSGAAASRSQDLLVAFLATFLVFRLLRNF